MVRQLPGVYITLNDLSTIPEGSTNLTVGYVLKAKRGPVGAATLVTSPSDFLNKFTLTGAPSPSDDVTYHSILKVLRQTNMVYVARAQKGALYGGLLIKKETGLGKILSMSKDNKTIAVDGDVHEAVKADDVIRVFGPKKTAGRYTVGSVQFIPASTGVVAKTVITVKEAIVADVTATAKDNFNLYLTKAPVAINTIKLGNITGVADIDEEKDGVEVEEKTRKVFTLAGDVTKDFGVGDRIRLLAGADTYYFTVLAANVDASNTRVAVAEAIDDAVTEGKLFRHSIANPEGFNFGEDDLFLVTGIDQGAYNGKLGIEIVSSTESPDELTEADIFTIAVYNATTGMQLEGPMMVSRKEDAKAFDGSGIYIENVVADTSAYIKVVNNKAVDEAEQPCDVALTRLGGGFDGEDVTEADMISALNCFADKTVPISVLGNGAQETPLFQQAMLELVGNRMDCVAILNDRAVDEKATFNSQKAQNIVDYKKQTLGSTTYLGAMYAPHLTVADQFNSRNVKIGADAIAIAGWLNTLLNRGMPNAYAGPTNGLVTGATCDWKIGDESGEAKILNDASINYVAFDAKIGRYYMQCQNTLQVANSALRNLGAVFNVLSIKETFATYMKEYIQRPITTRLREEILNNGRAQMDLMVSQERVTGYAFVDATSDYDMSNNTLRYVLALALTPYAQNIYLVMNVVNQMYDFSILQSL